MLSTKILPLATAYWKTALEYLGPLPITKAFYATDNYTVTPPDELNINDTFHVKHLNAYITNEDKRFSNRKNTNPGPLYEFDTKNDFANFDF